jgi:hypothetical protein
MKQADEIAELIDGYRVWMESDALAVPTTVEAPAATTTFCAFTVSYMVSRATVHDGC